MSPLPPTSLFTEHPSDRQLLDFLRGKLDSRDQAQIVDHVEKCEQCQKRLDRLTADSRLEDEQPQAAGNAGEQPVGPARAEQDVTPNAPCERPHADEDAAVADVQREKDNLPEDLFPDDDMPERIGKYECLELLGEGAFGRVYRARDPGLEGREVAIKILKRRITRREGKPRLDVEASRVAALREEACALMELEHPHIVRIYEFDQLADGRAYIVTRFIDGCSLAERMKDQRMSAEEAVELVATVAEALHQAHKQRLVHRDIKPANILLDTHGKPCIVDFGLALSDDDYGNVAAPQGGTPVYMSPEQARLEGHLVDNRSDIFSLGVVLYELLTGERPFRGAHKTEVLEKIKTLSPRPLRMLDDSISKELERICLKALSKRIEDRYTTALDFAEELRLATQQPVSVTTGSETAEHTPASAAATPDSKPPAAPPEPKIIPRGLRSFDEKDADFFLELLPGPHDRAGLPDSIAFWKHQIEETDADKTFRVGVLYGPSGCGKSSLVKAGLLPRLAKHVLPVFLQAGAEDTEDQLLRGLRKKCPRLPATLTLVEALAALRRGQSLSPGKKVCIVLDQFEQWLSAKRELENTELVRALRQCDGQHVQCIVTIREDFWMATTRFMRELEIRLLQGHNEVAVDLFDQQHARKVLTDFGVAYGRLPAQTEHLTNEQNAFLDQAVSELAEDDKVIPVKLALFVDMVKGKMWVPSELPGGFERIGEKFLEDTFDGSIPHFKLHQKAARKVLKALLPEAASGIKGGRRSRVQLLKASEYEDHPGEFEELVHILDNETRLITPVELQEESAEGRMETSERLGASYYQLTHDYLVPSLRAWLTRKQRETMRGRAELRLAERAEAYDLRPEKRHLPALWESVNVSCLTRPKEWTPTQRTMMRAATRYHAVRSGSIMAVALVVMVAVGYWTYSVRHDKNRESAKKTVENLLSARPAAVPSRLENLDEFPELSLAELRRQFQDESLPSDQRLHAAYGLAHFGDVRVDVVTDGIADAANDEAANIVAALKKNGSLAAKSLAEHAAKEKDVTKKVRLAATQLYLGSVDNVDIAAEMLKEAPDPVERTAFIESFASWRDDLGAVCEVMAKTADASLRSGLCLALGQVPLQQLTESERQQVLKTYVELYQNAPDTGTHSAARWCLTQQLQLELPAIEPRPEPQEGQAWHVNELGMTMLRMNPGKFVRRDEDFAGEPQTVELTKAFYMSDCEVSVGMFQEFMSRGRRGPQSVTIFAPPDLFFYSPLCGLTLWHRLHSAITLLKSRAEAETHPDWEYESFESYCPSPGHPVLGVSWYDAVRFCNWLSDRHGLNRCYERKSNREQSDVTRRRGIDSVEVWDLIKDANGYRLPTEAEWEYACRAGTTTAWSCGADATLLEKYCVFNSSMSGSRGSKLPNGWGLFDMHGNAWEWCHDWYGPYDAADPKDPAGPVGPDLRVLRGGGWPNYASGCRSAGRYYSDPASRINVIGFRVCYSLFPSRP